MSNKIKIIIEIDKDVYAECQGRIYFPDTGGELFNAVKNGMPLDSVKNKILDYNIRQHVSGSESFLMGFAAGMDKSAEFLDNTGKSEDMKKSCSTCKNSNDEFSGECYECLKGIFDHYEPEEVDNDNT